MPDSLVCPAQSQHLIYMRPYYIVPTVPMFSIYIYINKRIYIYIHIHIQLQQLIEKAKHLTHIRHKTSEKDIK